MFNSENLSICSHCNIILNIKDKLIHPELDVYWETLTSIAIPQIKYNIYNPNKYVAGDLSHVYEKVCLCLQ